ncbi:MAG: FimV/HubP family polar landmark protein [Porticoccus sp.]
MKLRNSILTVGFLATLFANTVFALGLGEIKLNSSLNEPLDMEIPLINVGELGELEMLVGLGSRADFEKAGVERLFLLTDLRFKVDLSKLGHPIIRVSSRKPIHEPYLDFLMELHWPTGRLLREYTLLLDLPLYATESPSAKKIEAASQSSQPKAQTGRQAQERSTKTAPSSVGTSSLAAGDGEYKVNSGDTVWGIAKKIKPSDASLYQTMAAIKQYNPQAFINDNINLLKKGAIIRLPEGSDIASLSHNKAVSDIAFETAELDDSQDVTAPMLDASDDVEESSTTKEAGSGQLKLAALDQDEALKVSGVGGDASGAGENGSNNTQNDLSVIQEELDKTQRENAELKARLANLEEQVATMSRLVEINDDSFRATQLVSQQAPDSLTDTPENNDEALAQESAVSVDAGSAEESSEVAATTEEPQSSGSTKQVGFDFAAWMDILLYPLIALLAILLAVVLFFRNRKQGEDEPDELSLRTLVNEPEPVPEPEVEDIEDTFSEKELEVLAEAVPEFDEQELKEFEELELGDGEGVDPVGEADIYLSLGNYNQAESVLANAIDKDPSNTSLRLKLLEVYVNANDLEKFDTQRMAMAELNDADADAKAVSLRSELTPEPLAGESDEEDSDSDDMSTEESTEAVDDESIDSVSSESEVSLNTGSDFDLDLDLDNVDMDSLSSDIDADIGDLGLDDAPLEGATEALDVEASSEGESLEALSVEESTDDLDGSPDNDLDAFGESDECDTKLELAKAYLDMGDINGARGILDEVVAEGSEAQQEKARGLLEDVT